MKHCNQVASPAGPTEPSCRPPLGLRGPVSSKDHYRSVAHTPPPMRQTGSHSLHVCTPAGRGVGTAVTTSAERQAGNTGHCVRLSSSHIQHNVSKEACPERER